jgi:hypothetical protein
MKLKKTIATRDSRNIGDYFINLVRSGPYAPNYGGLCSTVPMDQTYARMKPISSTPYSGR